VPDGGAGGRQRQRQLDVVGVAGHGQRILVCVD
jgi:hypothetical protein